MNNPGSSRRLLVLHCIARYHDERGYPPTHREVMAATGLRSTNTVAYHVRRLREDGYLVPAPFGVARSLALTSHGQLVLEESCHDQATS